MNKILLSVAMLALIGVASFGATRAFFSDTEVSAGNSFVAGSVDIEITGISDDYLDNDASDPAPKPIFTTDNQNGFSFELADLKPLDYGAVSYELSNDTNDAYVCAMVLEAGNAENGRIDPEIEAGDTTGSQNNTDTGLGELQNFMSFKFNNQAGLLDDIDGQWFGVGEILSGTDAEFEIGYCFGEYDGTACEPYSGTEDVNIAQTDSMFADVKFQAVQMRNNIDFECADLNDEDEEENEVVSTTGSGFSPTASESGKEGKATARYGDNNGSAGAYELEVGEGVGNRDEDNNQWTSREQESFVLDYDGSTTAMFTAGGKTVTWNSMDIPTNGGVGLTAKAPGDGSVAITNVKLDGVPLTVDNVTATNGGKMYIDIDAADTAGGFELTGDFVFTWVGGTANEAPAFEIEW